MRDRVTAWLREVAPSLRHSACAWSLMVCLDRNSSVAISGYDRCVASSGRIRSSAAVKAEGPGTLGPRSSESRVRRAAHRSRAAAFWPRSGRTARGARGRARSGPGRRGGGPRRGEQGPQTLSADRLLAGRADISVMQRRGLVPYPVPRTHRHRSRPADRAGDARRYHDQARRAPGAARHWPARAVPSLLSPNEPESHGTNDLPGLLVRAHEDVWDYGGAAGTGPGPGQSVLPKSVTVADRRPGDGLPPG